MTRLAFTLVGGRHTAGVDVTIYCGDAKQTVVGEITKTLDLKLGDETYQHALMDGLKYEFTVPVSADPKYVKAIVYDFGADLTGTVRLTLR